MPQAQIIKFPTEKQAIIDQIAALLDDMYVAGTPSKTIRSALRELHESADERFTYDE